MKLRFTAYLLAVLFLGLPITLVATSPGKGFLITLDGTKLTGFIKTVSFSKGKNQIHFENDFGDQFIIEPVTIYGFTFEENGETVLYESKYLSGEWQFLKVEKKGQALSLYNSAERQLQFSRTNESPIVVEEKNSQIWLQFAGKQPFKIHRLSYKGVLRKRMASYPDLAIRIGKRGFRYKDLSNIVDLYNKLHQEQQ